MIYKTSCARTTVPYVFSLFPHQYVFPCLLILIRNILANNHKVLIAFFRPTYQRKWKHVSVQMCLAALALVLLLMDCEEEMKSMSVLLYSKYLLPLYEGTDELGEL